jgi:hypothetical protein
MSFKDSLARAVPRKGWPCMFDKMRYSAFSGQFDDMDDFMLGEQGFKHVRFS